MIKLLKISSFLLFAGSLLTSVTAQDVERKVGEKPNIIFILADDLAWADVAFNGHSFFETPNIDKLAKAGMVLDQMYAGGPNCMPTRACIMSGTYSPRHHHYTPGGRSKGDSQKMRLAVPGSCMEGKEVFPSINAKLPASTTSLAEILGPAGYTTGRFGKWHLGSDTQGFDVSTSDGRDGPNKKHYGSKSVANTLTDAAVDFIDKNQKKPFFLYLSHWDVHSPIRAKPELIEKYQAKNKKLGTDYNPAYAGMVEQVDQSVRQIREAIEKRGLAENTIILFSSDNGGAHFTSNKPLKGAKGSLYEGGIRVPSCVYWKGQTPEGSTSDTVITSVDLMPTFTELAKGTLPAEQLVDGVSVLSAWKGTPKEELAERAVYWHFPLYLQSAGSDGKVIAPFGKTVPYFRGTPSTAMRKGDWKMIHFFETDTAELYNITKDPNEEKDLSSSEPEKHKAMLAELKAWQKATNAPVPTKLNPQFKE